MKIISKFENVIEYKIDVINDRKSKLTNLEFKKFYSFKIKRLFYISVKNDQNRGSHAHNKCNQLLFALSGKINIIVDNGIKTKQFFLYPHLNALYIPKMIWAKQKYFKNSVLAVACDQNYDEQDYIRDYSIYKKKIGVE